MFDIEKKEKQDFFFATEKMTVWEYLQRKRNWVNLVGIYMFKVYNKEIRTTLIAIKTEKCSIILFIRPWIVIFKFFVFILTPLLTFSWNFQEPLKHLFVRIPQECQHIPKMCFLYSNSWVLGRFFMVLVSLIDSKRCCCQTLKNSEYCLTKVSLKKAPPETNLMTKPSTYSSNLLQEKNCEAVATCKQRACMCSC